jgi:integrase
MSKLITFIKEEEFKKLLVAEKKREYKLAYLLAFGSGLRISEIIGYKRKNGKEEIEPLAPERVDIQTNFIKVTGGKGMKDRMVPLFPGFKKEHLSLLPIRIKRSTLQAHFKSLCKKVLKRDCHFHELRHGFGVLSTVNGVPMPFIQQAMGHSRLDTTGIYTAASPEEMKKAYDKAWGKI